MKWRNSKERELLANGGSRSQTLPTKNNPHPDLSDSEIERAARFHHLKSAPPPPPPNELSATCCVDEIRWKTRTINKEEKWNAVHVCGRSNSNPSSMFFSLTIVFHVFVFSLRSIWMCHLNTKIVANVEWKTGAIIIHCDRMSIRVWSSGHWPIGLHVRHRFFSDNTFLL